IATEAVRRIDELFAIERAINGRPAEERLVVREEQAKPPVIELEAWLHAQQARVSRRSEIGKALAYALNHWTALTRFLEDGRICMSNNAAERALRGIAVGRRNWTFAGSFFNDTATTEIYTLIAQLAAEGRAIVMISSEMPELLGMCDRICVMNEGRFVGEFTAAEATQEKIMRSIVAASH
ncbi:MAG: IS66 family transposase, partial [Rhizobacter sp.]